MGESRDGGETAPDIAAADRAGRQGVKALVRSSAAVLLVREHHVDGSAFWTLPGGGVRPGERSRTALRRELREELQCGAVVGHRLTTFPYAHVSRRWLSFYTVYDAAVTDQPVPNEAEGVTECRWVCPADPPASTLPQVRALLETGVTGTTH